MNLYIQGILAIFCFVRCGNLFSSKYCGIKQGRIQKSGLGEGGRRSNPIFHLFPLSPSFLFWIFGWGGATSSPPPEYAPGYKKRKEKMHYTKLWDLITSIILVYSFCYIIHKVFTKLTCAILAIENREKQSFRQRKFLKNCLIIHLLWYPNVQLRSRKYYPSYKGPQQIWEVYAFLKTGYILDLCEAFSEPV